MRVQSSGILDYWFEQHFPKDTCETKKLTLNEPVKLDDLVYVCLYVIGIGLGVASLALLSECVVIKIFQK